MKDAARVSDERERHAVRNTRFLVMLFPELATCAAAERWTIVHAARQTAGRRRLVLAASVAVLLPGAAWLVGVWAGWESAAVLLRAALVTMLLGLWVQYVQTRREVRAMLKARVHELNRSNGAG